MMAIALDTGARAPRILADRTAPAVAGRVVALGDLAGGSDASGESPVHQLAAADAELFCLAEADATASQMVDDQLALAVALAPNLAVISIGVADAERACRGGDLPAIDFADALTRDVETAVARLRRVDASVMVVHPLVLEHTPAAWQRFGRQYGPTAREPSLEPALRALGHARRRWSARLQAIARRHGAGFVDLAEILDSLAASGGSVAGRVVGLPPQAGDEDDLFADPLHLSPLGTALAAGEMRRVLAATRASRCPASKLRHHAPAGFRSRASRARLPSEPCRA